MNRRLLEGFAVLTLVAGFGAAPRASADCQWTAPAGTSIMYTNPCANVGIGTSSPAYRLDAQGNSFFLGTHASGGDALLHLSAGGSGNYSRINFGYWVGFDAGIWYLGRWADGTFRLSDFSGGAEANRLTVATSGNVGIGTTAPNYKLDAQGNTFFFGPHASGGGDTTVSISSAASANSSRINFGTWAGFDTGLWNLGRWGSDGSFRLSDFSSGAEVNRLFVGFNGNVGINTAGSAPATKLQVVTSDNADGVAVDGTTNPAFSLRSGGAVRGYLGLPTVGTAYFIDANANDLAIRSETGRILLGQCCAYSAAQVLGTTNFTFPGNPLTLTLNGSAAFNVPSAGAGINFNAIYNSSNQLTTVGAISGIRESTADGNYGGALIFGTRTNGTGAQSMERMRISSTGVVSINGTSLGTDTSDKLIVNGGIRAVSVIGATYQDVAEWVPASESMTAGTVVVVDESASNHVAPSNHAYDTAVAGVISAQPGVLLGAEGPSKVKVATTGRVKVHVDASRMPIHAGDLLVTSDRPGVAMRSEPVDVAGIKMHRPGTLIGKALEPLTSGEGEILVLLSLQ